MRDMNGMEGFGYSGGDTNLGTLFGSGGSGGSGGGGDYLGFGFIAFVIIIVLLICSGCGHKPVRVEPTPAPILDVSHPVAPAGTKWHQDGYCVPDGVDARDGGPSVLTCKTDDGRTIIWHR